ncbi:GNAT family N-acetyltransferase [Jannaschia sp. Os4]|uniref:GNAT family N-acetyltransferase n=1 Tax=Jannaschia sp. Os4 TaxID=2807617 RepID=UPI001939BD8C|nr:GNAT family N-acetyltransferase [Jannaschia sp. Os4]MBM2575728.1 GNAT family N-acetyltransferase [Jannaschia sp. Os4]
MTGLAALLFRGRASDAANAPARTAPDDGLPPAIPTTPRADLLATALQGRIPMLRTARAVLRAPRQSDFPALREIMEGERGAMAGGPLKPAECWADFCQATAVWLLRGHGMWTVATEGAVAGFVLIGTEPGDREHELGFLMREDWEGIGLAHEVAVAARDHAWRTLRLPSLVSYVATGNARSEALCRRLGAAPDGTMHDGALTVWRHPRPEDLA